jgi:hypothetical protein
VNRWQIADNVPFQKSFEAAIEKYYPDKRPTLYDAVVYWYQEAGKSDGYDSEPLNRRWGYYFWPDILRVKGAIEAEDLEAKNITAGQRRSVEMTRYGNGFSGDMELLWLDAKPGDTMDIVVLVEVNGLYRIKIKPTKAMDFGIIQLYWDGEKLGEPVDLYDRRIVPGDLLDFGIHEIIRGEHILRAEVVGTNPEANPVGYRFCLDYILLEKQ